MSSIRHPLVGRVDQLDAIADVLGILAGTDFGPILEIVGQPGVGKSRLLAELCALAEGYGYLVLGGRAAEFERQLPFAVLVDALDDYLASLETARLDGLGTSALAELATVFPSFVPTPDTPPAPQTERFRTYRAIRRLLARLARDQPLVLVLDDVHWADSASVELLAYLLSHPVRGPVLLVLSFRPAQVSPQLGRPLAAAVRDRKARRLELAPLSATEVDEFLGEEVPAARRLELCLESGGVPFYLEQLQRGSSAEHGGCAASAELSELPAAVQAALTSELSALSAGARALVKGAAVAGDPFDVDLAAAACSMDETPALTALDELVRLDVVRPTSVPRRFAFRHPIVRRAIYESAGAGWRIQAHARVATALQSRGVCAAGLAHHVERCAAQGDGGAVDVLIRAGDEAAARAPLTAAHWYAAALRLLPDADENDARRLPLGIGMATALGAAGEFEASHGVLCQAIDRLPRDDPGRVGAVAFCAGVEHLLGRHRDARARLLQAYEALADEGSAEAVSLQIELAAAGGYLTDVEQMRAWGERALAGSQALGLCTHETTAAGLVAYARYSLGLPAEPDLARATSLLDGLGDEELASRLDAALWVGWAEALLEHFDESIRHCGRAIDLSRATGHGAYLLGTMTAQVWALLWTGRLADARRRAEEAVEGFRLARNAFLSEAVGFASLVATLQGDLTAALRDAREGVELALRQDPGVMTAAAGLWLAMALLESGDPEHARTAVLSAAGGRDLPLFARACRAMACEVLVRAELALGSIDAAEAWAEEAEAATFGGGLPVESGFAWRAKAAVLLARGKAHVAASMALAAADAASAAGAPVEAGRSRLLAARALARHGQRQPAISQLERARDDLEACGAHGFRDQAEQQLRGLGRRVARQHRGGPGMAAGIVLSEREREVADLVCLGRTNRQIAAHCFLSEKTVERHVSHVFHKLGVSNRAALAGALARYRDGNRLTVP